MTEGVSDKTTYNNKSRVGRREPSSRFRRWQFVRDFMIAVRYTLASTISVLVIVGWLCTVVAAPVLVPGDPTSQDLDARLSAPSISHPFGTDQLGRDVLTRVLYGGRTSIPLGIGVVTVAAVLGTLIGSVAGYMGGAIDEVLMRIADAVLSFPSIVLAMALAAALGPGLSHSMVAIVFVWWPRYSRLMRGMVLSVKQKEFVVGARAVGASEKRIIMYHIWPNAFPPVLINATLDIGRGIMMGAWLGFLGLGAVPPTPEWGSMVASGAKVFQQWWVSTFPSLAILSIVLSLNILGDTIRDLNDPRTRTLRGMRTRE